MSTNPPNDIREHVTYDPETGVFTRLTAAGGAKVGDRCDVAARDGYLRVRFRDKTYQAHRLAWFFVTGEWPETQVDHINRLRGDNRLCNLRLATASQNSANTDLPARELPRGVTFHKKAGKYQAQVKHQGKNYHLGLFSDPVSAHKAYREHAKRLHGEFWSGADA